MSQKIVNQFECVGFDRDEFASEKCVCGKEELKWLYYMKNKKKINEEYALSTFIVGSSCINTFYKSRFNSFAFFPNIIVFCYKKSQGAGGRRKKNLKKNSKWQTQKK